MARLRDSRSPAGRPDSSRRRREDDDRRDRGRRDEYRDARARSRSRSPQYRRRDRGGRYRERDNDRDVGRPRDRSLDRRDDNHYRGTGRDYREQPRRRSRDRASGRLRSPERRRNRSRDSNRSRLSRDGSRDRAHSRRESTVESSSRTSHRYTASDGARQDGGRSPSSLSNSRSNKLSQDERKPLSEMDKKAERLAKLEAWKKKKENEKHKVNGPGTDNQAIKLLAELDKKATIIASSGSPSLASSAVADSEAASPAPQYAGKFDPKSIAKKSAAIRTQGASKTALGSLDAQPAQVALPSNQPVAPESALPANREKASRFDFGKTQLDGDKVTNKRKLDLDEDDTSQRKLKKLPALTADSDDTPYADQDDYESGDNIVEDEEAAVAADRAAHEKRLQAEKAAGQVDKEEGADEASAQPEQETPQEPPAPVENDKASSNDAPGQPEPMDVDVEEDVDPLDAFMADLSQAEATKASGPSRRSKKVQEPEAYFSDEDKMVGVEGDADADHILAMAHKRRKKDIPTIDYSKLELEPIRKNFWSEPAEVSALTDTEVADLRLEFDGIKVKGKNVPKPVQKWAHCGLTRQTLDVIEALKFEKPTSIQMQAIPALMSGRDVVGVAKTGSGKTLAFLLPMFRHIKDQSPLKDTDGPIGLILAPTRELATQIHKDCRPFLKSMGLRAVCAYGGAPVRDQIAELKRGAEVLVCTAGRLIELLAANQGRVTNLKRVTYMVLDEADRMFDMGFEPQVMKIFANLRPDKQTIMFSATMPKLIDSLTKKVLNNAVEITVGGRSVVAKEVEQVVEVRQDNTKFLRTLELLGELYKRDEDARTLIFVERQEKADDLLKQLMTKGYPCMSIHGGKDQVDRDSTISDFKNGVVPVLVATSVAARGLDVKQLKLVINYDAPNHLEDYVHRAGRTGRAGNTGVAVTFVTPEQENCASGIAKALEHSGQEVPQELDALRKAHWEKVKSGKAKITSGFGGKGLDRLDQEREAARQMQRRTHRAEGEEEEEPADKKTDAKDNKTMDAIKAAVSDVHSRDAPKPEIEFKVTRGGGEATHDGASKDKSKDPLSMVSSAASAINHRLGKTGQLRTGQPIDNKGPDAGAFHATLEINDFPQKARWAVTNRTNVAKILDSTGTSITTKGNFYAAGKEPQAGQDPKLYILIEGETEVAVSSALQELTRLLKEATMAAVDADNRAPASGRYTVT
ncbi:hypothetical protein CDD82_3961 [Ophiocordyceps australis]|uniref:RNA helicase n=1 Tax=Ophiocordyceps australis TaxID=1399860 RepID=A0A2C5ZBF3_9HYPO|nr:hypothetical protein CDD82_3961 [Ophiocordyceps australis]